MIISSIAAMGENRVIGWENQLPWHLPEDLKYFKEKTKGKVMIMGRKTFASIGRPLPERFHIIITRDTQFQFPHEKVAVVNDIPSAIAKARSLTQEYGDEVFIVGGAEIYKETMNLVDRIYLTVIEQSFRGDAFFPEIDLKKFKLVSDERHSGPMPFSFKLYTKEST